MTTKTPLLNEFYELIDLRITNVQERIKYRQVLEKVIGLVGAEPLAKNSQANKPNMTLKERG
jgi:hypothetical protein